jgi:release factor glutamine methyltransferase
MRLRDISKQLNSSLDARILVKHVTGLSDADLIGMDALTLTESQDIQLQNFIEQRLTGRPVAKIIGIKEFYGRDFIVNDDVLDPRPDSEVLIDVVLEWTKGKSDLSILELGVGSGCLVLTLLSELSNATAVGADISPQALTVAKQNAQSLGLNNRISFVESDWLDNVQGQFDVIITNPPYINSDVIEKLATDVREFDPMLALDGGEDGLNPYKVILPQIRTYMKHGGIVALEHGYDQCGRIKRLVENTGLSEIRDHQDLGGHDRVITAIHK